MLDGDYGSGANKVRIKGLSKTVRDLGRAGVDVTDMKDLMHAIGMLVVNAAEPPVSSGRLAGTLRAGRGKTKAVVRAGTAGVPYAGVLEYGWPARNIAPQSFLRDALQSQQGNALSALEDGLDEILRKNDLK